MGRRGRLGRARGGAGRRAGPGDPAVLKAVVFDFDGLILDTESPLFETWADFFREHGHELELERFTRVIGSADHFDPVLHLEGLVGAFPDREAVREQIRRRYHDRVARQPLLPGVLERLQEAAELGLPCGVASSSRRAWVAGHVERLGLAPFIRAIACREDPPGLPGKPAPDVYLAVCADLSVSPAEALAIEDSPNGVRAAKAAGLRCLAVPNALTAHLDLGEADLTAPSLAAVRLADLAD